MFLSSLALCYHCLLVANQGVGVAGRASSTSHFASHAAQCASPVADHASLVVDHAFTDHAFTDHALEASKEIDTYELGLGALS